MAVSSVILNSRLERAKRIDAEYYQPKYLVLDGLHKQGSWLPIAKFLDLCEYGISIKMNEHGNGYRIFRMGDLEDGFAFDAGMKYAPIVPSVFGRFCLGENDVLFNRVNSEEFVGRTGIFKLKGDYVFASYLVRLRTNSSLTPDVLNLFLNCRYGILSIRRLSRRAVNQANVNAQELRSILIPRFSDDLQRELTRFSNKSWELYAEAEDCYTKAEEVFVAELGLQDLVPKHSLAYVQYRRAAAQAHRLDAEYFQPKYDYLLDMIKANSDYHRFVRSFRSFNARGLQPIYFEDGELRVITSRHILDKCLDYANFDRTKQLFWDSQTAARVFRHDILIYSTGANVGRTAVYLEDEQALASNHVNILRLREENPVYVGFVLNSLVGRMQTRRLVSGTAQAELYPTDIDRVLVPFVAAAKQEQIASSIKQSHIARHNAKTLFDKAKRAVEIAIEEGEEPALDLLSNS